MTGYLKSTVVIQKPAFLTLPSPLEDASSIEDENTYTMVQNKVRTRLFFEPTDQFSFEAAYEIAPIAANPSLMVTKGFITPQGSSFRLFDFDNQIWNDADPAFDHRDVSLFHNLDRFNLNLSLSFADIHFGRQAISFGSGKAINPTDIFSPFLFQDLNKEEKIGVDAVRVRIPMGDMSEIDLGVVLGDDGKRKNSAAYVRSRIYFMDTDMALILMEFQRHAMVGVDMASALFDAGVWIEGAYVFTDTDIASPSTLPLSRNDEDYFRLTVGFDYTFENNTYLALEYHYNSPGTTDEKRYLLNTVYAANPLTGTTLPSTAYDAGGVYLLGKHYLIPSITYEVTPLIAGSVQALLNLTDLSSYLRLGVEYNVKENLFFEFGGFFPFGDSVDGEALFVIPKSEFGLYSKMGYAGIRYYF